MSAGLIAGDMALGTCTDAGGVREYELSGHERSLDAEPTLRVSIEQVSPGILRIDLKPQAHIIKADGELARARLLALANGDPICVLINVTGVESVSRDAVMFYSEASHVAAFALLGSTAVDKVIAHALRGLDCPHCPVRYFVDEEEALAWLEGYC